MIEKNTAPKTILVIDDEEIIRVTFRFFLEDHNYNVLTAENGKEGIKIFDKESADLVLTDLRMPEMNGLKVLSTIREKSPETPVIVISGAGIIGDAVEALNLGAWNYILKPIEDLSVMLHVVKNALEKAKLIRENRDYQKHLEKRTAELQTSLENFKLAQTRLIESEKMAALGSLVAGVSHEINTPIGIGVSIASHLEEKAGAVQKKYGKDELSTKEFEEFLNTVKESSSMLSINMNRAADLIRSFKQVAVDQTNEEKREFDISIYLEEILTSMSSEFKKHQTKIDVSCSRGILITGFPGVFSQIITNLAMNSIHHGFDRKKRGKIGIRIDKPGENIRITFQDDGIGIPPENQKKIFEPFFTTDRNKGGCGLGLNIVYNLVTRKLKGSIECESIPGEGTRFIIEFPAELK